MKKISLFICLIIVLNVFSACGENNKDESKATTEKANSSKTSVSNVVSESSSKETTTSSDTSKETSSSDNDSEASSALESDINSSKDSHSSRFVEPSPPDTGKHFSASEFIEFVKTPFDSQTEVNKKIYSNFLAGKKIITQFMFIKALKGYEIYAVDPNPLFEGYSRLGSYRVYLRRKSSQKEDYDSVENKFNIGIYYDKTERPVTWKLKPITGYTILEFDKKKHDKWGEYYISKKGDVLLFKRDDFVFCISNKLGQTKSAFQKEWLNAFDTKYISKPYEIPLNTSSETSATESSSENISSLENNSSETQSSDISSENASSQNTTSSEETSTQ